MRIVVTIVLALLTAGLIYVLYSSINEPIKFRTEKDKRLRQVVNQLIDIRKAQEMYVDIKGMYATTFDSLRHVLRNDEFMFVSIEGDPDDPNFVDFDRDTTYRSAIDSVEAIGLRLDSLEYIPFSNGKQFTLFADTINYESSNVNVVEVSTTYNDFMGIYADRRYARYDDGYDPAKVVKFGDRTKPIVTGNWEQ